MHRKGGQNVADEGESTLSQVQKQEQGGSSTEKKLAMESKVDPRATLGKKFSRKTF